MLLPSCINPVFPFHNLDVQTMNEYQMTKSVPDLPILHFDPLRYTSSDGCIIRELLKVTIRGVDVKEEGAERASTWDTQS